MPNDLFAPAASKTVPVLLPLALDQAYDYLVPDDISVSVGDFVLVPLARQQRIGVVWEGAASENRKPVNPNKLKTIISKVDAPSLPVISITFAEWVARYNLMPIGMVLRMMMSANQALEPAKPRFGVKLDGPSPSRMTPARKRVLKLTENGLVWHKGTLAEEAGVSPGVIDGLVKSGTLISVEIPKAKLPVPNPHHASMQFSDTQNESARALRSAVQAQNFSVTLLDGVTGSGKTEVYFEAVAEALDLRRQVLILLPEIALTSEFIARFEARFGCRPVEWHSALSGGERGRIWRAIASGEARAIVGARSALFLPFTNLGLIVVDEEHDTGFKQEDRVTYHGRDMSVVRASLGQIPIVLASATPSIESFVNAKQGRYRHVLLPERFSGQSLPEITGIDLRRTAPERGCWLSPILVEAMTETLHHGQQSLLFLNRRGYAPLTLCRNCGFRFDCPQCSAWLVEHRFRNRLQCHHCGFSTPQPKSCPKCQEQESLVPCGPGVERVAEEIKDRFPDARLAILSSDLAPNIQALREVLHQVTEGEADIIIGTQLVAKGHNFPGLATVGVVDGDLGLGQADPRAAERTYQLLHQVTGRAGRVAIKGRGFVQTHNPEHPVMQALISGDREFFIEQEIIARQSGDMPPFSRLASLIISARSRDLAGQYARHVALKAPPAKAIIVLGPAEAPITVIRGRYRYRLLIKAPREADIQAYLRSWFDTIDKPKGDLRLAIDIDPYNFL